MTTDPPILPPRFRGPEAGPYYGECLHAVDLSHRVMLPAHWRGEGCATRLVLLPWPLVGGQFILALPPERWDLMAQRLLGGSLANRTAAAIERLVSTRQARVELDATGRLALPIELTRVARIRQRAALVGCLDRFEVWNPSRRRAAVAADEALAARALEDLIM